MVAPLLIGVGIAGLMGASWLGGKSASGGMDLNTELFTSKKYNSTQTTDTSQTTISNIYSPTVTRTVDIAYNIASGSSSISTQTKKEMGVSPSTNATQTPSLVVIPSTAQGGGIGGGSSGGSGAGFDFMTPLVIAGFVAGGYVLIKKTTGKKKK